MASKNKAVHSALSFELVAKCSVSVPPSTAHPSRLIVLLSAGLRYEKQAKADKDCDKI